MKKPKKKRTCIACEVQDKISSAPHEPGCRCYGIAYLMGIAQAASMAQTGDAASLCDACLLVIQDLAAQRGVEAYGLYPTKESVDVH